MCWKMMLFDYVSYTKNGENIVNKKIFEYIATCGEHTSMKVK